MQKSQGVDYNKIVRVNGAEAFGCHSWCLLHSLGEVRGPFKQAHFTLAIVASSSVLIMTEVVH